MTTSDPVTPQTALTRDEAWTQLCEWTHGASLRKHARAVEVVMAAAAHRYGRGEIDEVTWRVTGLLHDADYERWPETHPSRIVAWLESRGEGHVAQAVSAHYTAWQVPCESALDKALIACDELTGFIVACSLVRPEGVHTLKPKSVKKKLKDKAFAAKVDRGEVKAGMERLGVDPGEHITFIIDALKPHAQELGISGTATGREAGKDS